MLKLLQLTVASKDLYSWPLAIGQVTLVNLINSCVRVL